MLCLKLFSIKGIIVKVYLAGFVYAAIISAACYFVKSTDGLSGSGKSRNKLWDTRNTTLVTQARPIYIARIDDNINLNVSVLRYYLEHHNETEAVSAKEEIQESILNIIEDEVFWSSKVERLLPKGKIPHSIMCINVYIIIYIYVYIYAY